MLVAVLVLGSIGFAEASSSNRMQRHAATPPSCNGGFCSSLAHYPVNGTQTYAEFDVPALPKKNE